MSFAVATAQLFGPVIFGLKESGSSTGRVAAEAAVSSGSKRMMWVSCVRFVGVSENGGP